MKFGKLVLKSVSAKGASKRASSRRGGRRPGALWAATPRALPRTAPPPGPAPSVPAQPVQTLRAPEVLPAEPPRAPGTLTTGDLIRPAGRLEGSLEGFFLDQRSEHTRRAYGKDLKRFVKFLLVRRERQGVEPLNRTVIIAYKDFLLNEGLEHSTVDRHLATLRSLFKWLADDGLLDRNPAERVRFMKGKRLSSTNAFTDDEVRRLLLLPDLHSRTGALHYAVLMVLFYCGIRRSELCALRTSNLSEERGHKVLRLRGKGGAERLLVVIPPVWNAIVHYFRITGREPGRDGYLFQPVRNRRTGVRDKALDPSMVFYVVQRYAKLAGIAKKVSPHSCRATAISNARDHNVSDRAIQEFAGWASPDMITRYDKRKTAIEKSASHAIRYGDDQGRLNP